MDIRQSKHGHTDGRRGQQKRTKIYRTWENMRSRCNNPNTPQYKFYGGRGVTICERWNSFNLFLEDMGEKPEGSYIDRIDYTKGYSPDNCRWADEYTHRQNKRKRG